MTLRVHDIDRIVAALHRACVMTGTSISKIKMSKAAFNFLAKQTSKEVSSEGKLAYGKTERLFAIPVELNEDKGISASFYDGFGNRVKKLWIDPSTGKLREE